MSYKVLYHQGNDIGLKTKCNAGRLSLNHDCVTISGSPKVTIPLNTLRAVELFRLHGTGRMLKIDHTQGTLFVTVIRFSLFGLFAIVNFFATGQLKQKLDSVIKAGTKK